MPTWDAGLTLLVYLHQKLNSPQTYWRRCCPVWTIKVLGSNDNIFVCSWRLLKDAKTPAGSHRAKCWTCSVYFSWSEPRDTWEDVPHMVLWSYFSTHTHTHRQNLMVAPPIHMQVSDWLSTQQNEMSLRVWERGCVWKMIGGVSLYSLTQHFCAVIPVISLQFPHCEAKRDLSGSLSKCLKHKIDDNVCLPYIFPRWQIVSVGRKMKH